MEQKITLIDACIDFLNAGDYEKAIEVGKLAVEKYPDNLLAYLCLGEAYYRTFKFDAAYENFKKAESLTNKKENLMQIYSRIGQILENINNLDDALTYYNKSLSLAKDLGNTDIQAIALKGIANIYYQKGELDEALGHYQEYLSLEKNEKEKPIVYNNIGNIYYEKGNYQKAIENYQKAIEIAERYKDYFYVSFSKLNLGEVYRNMKDYKNAEKYLSEGLEVAKKLKDKFLEATGCLSFARLYRDKGYREKAEEYYNRAYDLYISIGAEGSAFSALAEKSILSDSSNDSPLKKIGNFFYWVLIITFILSVLSKHRGMSCIQNNHKQINNVPSAQGSQEETNNNYSNQNDYEEINKCLTLINSGNYQKAIRVGKLVVEKYPDNPKAYACLGTSYFYIGKLKLAYKNLKKAESLASNKEDLIYIYNLLGLILKSMGYSNDALLYYDRSLSLAKELGDTYMKAKILNNIATIYANNGEFDEALSYYNESLSLITNEKDRASIYNNIASIYYIKGDYDKAAEYFQKAIEIAERYKDYHNASRIKLNLGVIYEVAGDYENAEKYLTEGLEGVKRAGDEFWEAKGYSYFGALYRDKGEKETAIEYYTHAYNLFKSIGAEKDAKDVLNDIKELDKSK